MIYRICFNPYNFENMDYVETRLIPFACCLARVNFSQILEKFNSIVQKHHKKMNSVMCKIREKDPFLISMIRIFLIMSMGLLSKLFVMEYDKPCRL